VPQVSGPGRRGERRPGPNTHKEGRYVVVYRDRDGKQRKETARTLDDARALKRRRDGGETNAAGRLTFAEYAREWIERHPARDSTRADYRRQLERWIIPFIASGRSSRTSHRCWSTG